MQKNALPFSYNGCIKHLNNVVALQHCCSAGRAGKSHCNCNCTFTDILNGGRESIWDLIHEKKSHSLAALLLVERRYSHTNHSISNCVATASAQLATMYNRTHTHIINLTTSKCHKMRSKWYHRLKFSVTICMYCNMSALLDCSFQRLAVSSDSLVNGFSVLVIWNFDWLRWQINVQRLCECANTRESLWYEANVMESQI